MKSVVTHSYTQSVDELAAAFLDEDFVTAKLETLGSRNVNVDVTAYEDDTFDVIIEREAKADVPRALQSVVKPWNAVKQVEKWEGSEGGPYVAKIAIETEGVPAKINSVVTLSGDADSSECEIVTNIECSIPLIGKKLAQFIAKETVKSTDDEAAFIAEHA